jgi:serine/threonine-protein kinase
MTDSLHQLQAALADRYTIEGGLGRGGMAIVFLADDCKVVLKALRTEFAASLGAERFLREITTVARLAHPSILPLHDSGDADGALSYLLPEIFRHRSFPRHFSTRSRR